MQCIDNRKCDKYQLLDTYNPIDNFCLDRSPLESDTVLVTSTTNHVAAKLARVISVHFAEAAPYWPAMRRLELRDIVALLTAIDSRL